MNNIRFMEIAPDEKHELRMDAQSHFGTFEVKDDATLWQKVNKLAHSTFDISKFEKVGSPIITNDGIASGFSSSNYINASGLSISSDSEIVIRIRNIVKSSSSSVYLSSSTMSFNIEQYSSPRLSAVVRMTNSAGTVLLSGGITTDHVAEIGDIIDTVITLKSGANKLEVYRNGTLYQSTTNTNTFATDQTFSLFRIGNNISNTAQYSRNDINLKQFSITVDGVSVFSGNKTGIDTIKPDDYTPSSPAPTITNDGIMPCGQTTETAANISHTIVGDLSNFELDFSFIAGSDAGQIMNGDIGQFVDVTYGANSIVIHLRKTSNVLVDNSTQTITGLGTLAGKKIYVKIIFNNGQGEYRAKAENGEWKSVTFTSSDTSFTPYYPKIVFNARYSIDRIPYWDLNDIRFYNNGSLEWQPCLKIPYTEGQNYVKVVDKLYRDRVKDLFEQEGYNIYYTLGEDDFTLPSNKPNDIVKYKADGLTVAEQRADQTLTIRGACEQGVDVNLPMDFFSADSYAVFGVGTTGTNTASKFTPAADGNYIAIGKGKV